MGPPKRAFRDAVPQQPRSPLSNAVSAAESEHSGEECRDKRVSTKIKKRETRKDFHSQDFSSHMKYRYSLCQELMAILKAVRAQEQAHTTRSSVATSTEDVHALHSTWRHYGKCAIVLPRR